MRRHDLAPSYTYIFFSNDLLSSIYISNCHIFADNIIGGRKLLRAVRKHYPYILWRNAKKKKRMEATNFWWVLRISYAISKSKRDEYLILFQYIYIYIARPVYELKATYARIHKTRARARIYKLFLSIHKDFLPFECLHTIRSLMAWTKHKCLLPNGAHTKHTQRRAYTSLNRSTTSQRKIYTNPHTQKRIHIVRSAGVTPEAKQKR